MTLTRVLYLAAILFSVVGVLALNWVLGTGVLSRRLIWTIAITVPLFLIFDIVGAASGWFWSNPHLNLLIVPPGIPLEEPILLAFLTLVSISLWQGARRLR
jgi:lycopene cyclase domain-containing protein